MKYILIFSLIIIFIFLYRVTMNVLLRTDKSSLERASLIINDYEFKIDIADNPISQSIGLSGRDSIEDNYGMLFVFRTKKIRKFWMKGMNFPIDIIWIDDNKVIKISKYVQPPSVAGKIITVNSDALVDKVLEIKSGMADKINLKIGDEIKITRNEK